MKKIISILLTIILIVSTVSGVAVTSFAANLVKGGTGTYTVNGTLTGTITWKYYNDGMLNLSGSGEVEFDSEDDQLWSEYRTDIKAVVIEDGIEKIPEYAFYGSESIETVSVPDTVTSIGDYAFYGCKSIDKIVIPESVTSIGKSAFKGCDELLNFTVMSDDVKIAAEGVGYNTDGSVSNTVINCHIGSFAAKYAENNGVEYSFINDGSSAQKPTVTTQKSTSVCYVGDSASAFSVNVEDVTRGLITYQWYKCSDMSYSDAVKISGAVNSSYTPSDTKEGTYYYFVTVTVTDDEAEKNKVSSANSVVFQLKIIDKSTVESTAKPTAFNNLHTNTYDYNTYFNWSAPVQSYLYYENGCYVRGQHLKNGFLVEKYDESYQLKSATTINDELPLFGGCYIGSQYNFLIFGHDNMQESDSQEVIRIVRYTKQWDRIDSCSIYGSNTYIPFDGGSLRACENDGKLYVRTCHEIYAIDNVHHQTNMTFTLDINSMKILYNNYGISNISSGYVSHSFNQFITYDEATDRIVTLDHGDAHPREVTMCIFEPSFVESSVQYAGGSSYFLNKSAFDITGDSGDNFTGVNVGAITVGSSNYLTVLSSVKQDSTFKTTRDKDVILVITPKNGNAAGKTINLTNYNSGISAGSPYIVNMNNGNYMVTWEEFSNNSSLLRYVAVDEKGNMKSSVGSSNAYLSDCEPKLIGGNKIVWYTSDDTALVFNELNLDSMTVKSSNVDMTKTVNPEKEHSYSDWTVTTNATCTVNGVETRICSTCGKSETREIIAKGHVFGEWTVVKEATYTSVGLEERVCSVCGEKESRVIDKLIPEPDSSSDTTEEKPTVTDSKPTETESTQADFVMGDLTGDGKVTAADARIALRISAKLADATAEILRAADTDGNGKITAADARKLLRVAAKLESF